MSNILYNNQHRLNLKPIYDPTIFKTMLEKADKDLIGFFDELYAGTNPSTKSETTNENNKKKLVSLCYFLASINNKYINGIKVDIGSYLQTSGASSSSIDTLANIGISVTRKTVNYKKNLISNEHQQAVNDYCLQNLENIFILNIDNYDGRIQNYHELRSMSNSKLVDFILHPLHSTKDYIECLDHVFKAFERLENINEENYLNNFVIPVIADWPGQVNIRRAIILRIKKGINS